VTLSGVAVTAGQSITVANITGGNLKFVPAANGAGAGYASFTFQVQDDGGTANSGVDLDQSANTITVNVTAVNDAPAGTNTTVTALEDTQYVFSAANFGFTDPNDSPANALTAVKITTIPGAGSLTLSGVAVTAGQTVYCREHQLRQLEDSSRPRMRAARAIQRSRSRCRTTVAQRTAVSTWINRRIR
jgi:hypothetical protein